MAPKRRYHIREDGNPGICQAAVGNCPYGKDAPHYPTAAAARYAYSQGQPASIPVKISKDREKSLSRLEESKSSSGNEKNLSFKKVEEKAIAAPNKYRLSFIPGQHYFDYDYDSYECQGDVYEEGYDDYCRDSVYEGLRVINLDRKQILGYASSCIGTSVSSLPKELEKELDENMEELTNPDNWDIQGVPGYYGEEPAVYPNEKLEKIVSKWFYNQPGAVDNNGILPYLRGFGFDTAGKKPLEAVKEYLTWSNNGVENKHVEAAKDISFRRVKLKDISIPNQKHLEKIEEKPLTAVPETGNRNKIAGILINTGPNVGGNYGYFKIPEKSLLLVDGYHRLKFLTNRKKANADYIVLETFRKLF